MSNSGVYKLVNIWHGGGIFWTGLAEVFVVDAHHYFLVHHDIV